MIIAIVVGLLVVRNQNNTKVLRGVFTNFVAGFILIASYFVETLYLKKYNAIYSGTYVNDPFIAVHLLLADALFFIKTPFSVLGTSILYYSHGRNIDLRQIHLASHYAPSLPLLLLIDEKLIIVKTLFLPLIRTFQNLVKESEKSQTETDFMRQGNENMTLDIFNSFEYEGEVKLSDTQALDKALTEAMLAMCTKLQGDWKASCYPMIKAECSDASWNIGGVIGFFAPWMFCPTIATEMCKEATDLASVFNTVEEFCAESTSSNESVFNFLFNKIGAYWERIRREIIADPETISVNQQLMGDLEGFNLFQAKWTWWLHVIIDFGLSTFVLHLLGIALFQAISALTTYKSNDDFTNNYLSKDFIESRVQEAVQEAKICDHHYDHHDRNYSIADHWTKVSWYNTTNNNNPNDYCNDKTVRH